MSRDVKLIDNYIYFYHLEKYCVLPVYPESLTDVMSSTFASTNALARSAPVFTYSNSGPRTVQIALDLHRDLMNDINVKQASNLKSDVVDFKGYDYVDTLINYLQAAAVPRYKAYSEGSKSVIPPMVAIRFGNDTFIKGVVNSGISVTKKKPIMSDGKYACVSINFTVSESDPYDADTVVNDGSFRGLTRSFRDGIYQTATSAANYASKPANSNNTTYVIDNTVYVNGKKITQRKNQTFR